MSAPSGPTRGNDSIALCALILLVRSCRATIAASAGQARGQGLPAGTTPASRPPPWLPLRWVRVARAPRCHAARAVVAASASPGPRMSTFATAATRLPTGVGKQWQVMGLEMEDLVAHYDTSTAASLSRAAGVHLQYAIRRTRVVSLMANGGSASRRFTCPQAQRPHTASRRRRETERQAGDEIGARPPVALRSKQGKDVMSTAIGPRAFQDAFKPYENLAIIRQGVFEAAEMPFLARGANAAIAWSHTQAVQIILDRKGAMAEVKYDHSQSVYTVTAPPGNPRLRVVKVASTPFAQPGDEVDFTVRFDNIGNQPIGNVTIIDSLNTRLEYVAGSAQCSVEAQFFTQPNEGGSAVVRCEVADPLEPGHGGVLRFRCRVR